MRRLLVAESTRRRLLQESKSITPGIKSTKKKSSSKKKVYDCSTCGLCRDRRLLNPKIPAYGKGRKRAVIEGEGPGNVEDRKNKPFVGQVGMFFRPFFVRFGLDMFRDFKTFNAVDCRPMTADGSNRPPTMTEIRCCYSRKEELYESFRPSVILLLGDSAIKSFYGCNPDRKPGIVNPKGDVLSVSSLRGKVIPDRILDAWVCHSNHPSYIVRGKEDLRGIFEMDFAVFVNQLGKPRPSEIGMPEIQVITLATYEEVINFLDDIWYEPFAFDYETSSFRYYEGNHSIHMVSVSRGGNTAYVFPYDYVKEDGRPYWKAKQFRAIGNLWKEKLLGECFKVAQNLKHEMLASKYGFGVDLSCPHWCTMIASHVLDGVKKITSLKTQVYIRWGEIYGKEEKKYLQCDPKEKNKFEEMDFKDACKYCGKDSGHTYNLYQSQVEEMKEKHLEKAYLLLHEGSNAFSIMEQQGIRIDVSLGKKWKKEWGEKLGGLKEKIMSCEAVKRFEKKVGRPPNYKKKLSGKDLQVILFDILKLPPGPKTKTGYSVTYDTLSALGEKYKDAEFLQYELQARKLDKMLNTYLAQFMRLQVDGYIYPSNNLHIPSSYRSSNSGPNFQNIIKHSEEGRVIRKLIIPRDGNQLITADYASMEVRVIACASHDQALIDYIVNNGDPHGDQAREIFRIDERDERWGDLRFTAKNSFVFAEFYGSWYKPIARNIEIPEDFFPTNTPLRRKEKWEGHIRKCEEKFWKKFHGVREWQDRKYDEYLKSGFVRDDAWGFIRSGYLVKEKVYNFPIQGPAFHCLLWSIINYYKSKMRNELLCAQIHDEMFFDAPPTDEQKLREVVTRIMTQDVREQHDWIIVPLEVEWEKSDKSWYHMEKIKD